MSESILLLGAGYSARAFAGRLAAERPAARVLGTTRDRARFPDLEEAGIEPFAWSGGAPDDALAEAVASATHLVVSAAPGESGDPVLAALGPALVQAGRLAWVGYLSTVGVYGDAGGAWIDEDAPLRPGSPRAAARVEAEAAWQRFGGERGLPVAVLRLSGIYGPGRNALVNLDRGAARRLVKPGQVFNRIHVEDIAGSLSHLSRARLGGSFNVTDDEPAPPQDVVTFAAGLMGVSPPPEQDFATAELSPMARSFYGENKRASNAKLKAAGYIFRFPDYRAALSAMWADGSWRGRGEADRASAITSG